MRETLSALFEDEGGICVRQARSFASAEAALDEPASIDVVLLDEHLGDGSGSNLVPRIRETSDAGLSPPHLVIRASTAPPRQPSSSHGHETENR